MSKREECERDYIEVPIHQSFYYNSELEQPVPSEAGPVT